MTTTTRTDQLAERLFSATVDALELFSVYLGSELGLYAALHADGPATPPQLAQRAGIAERYAREWLEQQAVAGLLEVEAASEDPLARSYALPAEHARVLVDPDDAAHVAPFGHLIAGIGGVIGQVAAAYRSGGVTHCLPTQMVEQPTAATGTVMRAGTVREYATAAGFGRVTVLPVENDVFRLYRLDG